MHIKSGLNLAWHWHGFGVHIHLRSQSGIVWAWGWLVSLPALVKVKNWVFLLACKVRAMRWVALLVLRFVGLLSMGVRMWRVDVAMCPYHWCDIVCSWDFGI
jgi:hypothetical protein